eukprot:CAMPEP_0115841160 /NCGR_PEP_ID=MMETSP0287-20121206/7147_1 /TAXON_ID=412157 /ORGANISM="Chrysochromulina rotalis, Strain UIO044" /LENGTH=208 /DNA_ID=CAMNT_0003294801 /DNA_START=34 /DNA_END=660 /DNA_ORIENTATION=+
MAHMHAAVHAPQGEAPPSLGVDLALVASLSPDHLGAFCGVARELLRAPEDTATFRKAARQLSVDTDAVEAAVRGLCYLMVSATVAGRPAEDLLQGLPLDLSEETAAALIAFYREEAPALEQELRCGLALPHYNGLDWRLQVQLGGRYTARKAPQANFLLRLHTSGGSQGPAEQIMTADLPNMRRLASELELALKEDRSSHSRRIARRI